jgi:hypothetical protein
MGDGTNDCISQKGNLLRLMRDYDQPKPFNVLHINRTFSKIKSYIAFLSRIVTIANFFILFLKVLEGNFCCCKKILNDV